MNRDTCIARWLHIHPSTLASHNYIINTHNFYVVATPCHMQTPLLELPMLRNGGDDTYYKLVSDKRISANSHLPPHLPREVRMSGDGWCANRTRIDMGRVESANQYLTVDFGAEVIVEAISIGIVNDSSYVTRYFVEYGSNTNDLHRIDADSVSFWARMNIILKLYMRLGLY